MTGEKTMVKITRNKTAGIIPAGKRNRGKFSYRTSRVPRGKKSRPKKAYNFRPYSKTARKITQKISVKIISLKKFGLKFWDYRSGWLLYRRENLRLLAKKVYQRDNRFHYTRQDYDREIAQEELDRVLRLRTAWSISSPQKTEKENVFQRKSGELLGQCISRANTLGYNFRYYHDRGILSFFKPDRKTGKEKLVGSIPLNQLDQALIDGIFGVQSSGKIPGADYGYGNIKPRINPVELLGFSQADITVLIFQYTGEQDNLPVLDEFNFRGEKFFNCRKVGDLIISYLDGGDLTGWIYAIISIPRDSSSHVIYRLGVS